MAGRVHHYRVHGLALRSEIIFPELIPDEAGARPDVEVVIGPVPTALPDPLFDGALAQAGGGAFLLRVPGVAGYYFSTLSRVVIEPHPRAGLDDVRTFFLSSVMGALIHAHERLPLHASAVQVGSGCVLVAGVSGSGKSTLAGELVRRGLELVSDDLTTISVGENGEVRAEPGYRALRLWSDALPRLAGISAEAQRGRKGHHRRMVVVPGAGPSASLAIRSVYILGLGREGPVVVRPLRGAAKLRAIIEQTYRLHLLPALGSSSRHYRTCLALAQRTPVYQMDRPADVDTVTDLAREIALREEILP